MTAGNVLYYGDNLDVLRRHIADESVDLVYLDPPFNSSANYNVLFAEQDGSRAAAQIRAFEDTWRWDQSAAEAYQEAVEAGGRIAEGLRGLRSILGDSDMLAYLSMMAPRLVELRRVMKPTASIYLHCDPTASHYLKLLMDAVFGPEKFLNEIIWQRTTAHSHAQRFGPVHDTLLFYSRGREPRWNPIDAAHSVAYLKTKYRYRDSRGLYRLSDLTGSGTREGPSGQPWREIDVTSRGRHWMHGPEQLEAMDAEGEIYWPAKAGGVPAYKRYLDEGSGRPLQDIWTDISPINSMAAERLGYPTQKPVALLERILEASSDEGNVVLDPFCGCGTTIDAAQKLGRGWIGIDITHLAIGLIRTRLADAYGPEIAKTYRVIGEPTDVEGARDLARSDPYQFQWWALGLIGARPVEEKKGGDKGIDGRLYFHEGRGDTKQVIISVKAGNLAPTYVRDLRGVVQREGAQIGVLLSFETPSQGMRTEAAGAGFYKSPWGNHPRLQLLTVGELLKGSRIDYPAAQGANVTFRRAQRTQVPAAENLDLFDQVAEAEPDEPYGGPDSD